MNHQTDPYFLKEYQDQQPEPEVLKCSECGTEPDIIGRVVNERGESTDYCYDCLEVLRIDSEKNGDYRIELICEIEDNVFMYRKIDTPQPTGLFEFLGKILNPNKIV